MIASSTAFQNAVAAESRLFRARFLANGSVVPGEVRKVVITKGSCGSSEFSPGVAYSAYIEATIEHCTIPLEGLELQLQIGIMTGGTLDQPTMDYITIGYFTVDRPATSAYGATFTAQGRISSKMSVEFTPPSTLTLANIAANITTATGVPISFDPEIDQTVEIGGDLSASSCRQVLAILASAVGGYAAETAGGSVQVCIYRDAPNAEYTADIMRQLPAMADLNEEVTGIEVIVSEDTEEEEGVSYTAGDPINLTITDEHMTAGAFAVMAANLIGLTYRPGNVQMALGDPRLEPWDVCRIVDIDDTTYILPCMEVVHTFDGGVITNICAPGLPSEIQMPSSIEKATKIARSAMSLASTAQSAAEAAQTSAAGAASAAAAALSSANAAASSASAASSAASAAQSDAASAATEAAQAHTSADAALVSASTANTAANSALTQLSTLEDVIGTLNWIAEHGTYVVTSDTTVTPGKLYFARGEEYILSTDTSVVSGKTYYSRSGSGTETDPYVYTVVTDPTGSPASNGYFEMTYSYTVVTDPQSDPMAAGYYELDDVDETLSNYLSIHLALANDGLYVISDVNGWKVRIANDGVYIINEAGVTVASYGAEIILGDQTGLNYMKLSGTGFGVTMDGGTSEVIAARIIGGSGSDGVMTFGNTFYGQGTSYTVNLSQYLQSGTPITIEANFVSSVETPPTVHTDTITLTVGTAGTASLFVYEGRCLNFIYDGNFTILITSMYEWVVTLQNSTIRFKYQTDRSVYYTMGARSSGSQFGKYSMAEGQNIEASGDWSHAEGDYTKAAGNYSHAEGCGSEAQDSAGHAEGYYTKSVAKYSHAEGYHTEARGKYSHAQNNQTKAIGEAQTAIGKFNATSQTAALMIGNGTSDQARSNALEVDWDGNVEAAGEIEDGSGNVLANKVDMAEPYFELDTTAAAGTTDGDLYAAITALSWESEVIV